MSCKAMKFQLPSGHFMPLIGFGTYKIRGEELIKSVLDFALQAGYRQIDTATVYGNEADIGKALKVLLPKYNLKREDIFITSKLSPSDQGDKAYQALQRSISNLDCTYLDLYLIHWPGAGSIPGNDPDNKRLRSESWQSLAKGVKDGLVRDIGISNYTAKHVKELLANDFGVRPGVNQLEWHPYYHDNELKNLLEKEKILLQAYSSLGGTNNPTLFSDDVVKDIAKRLGKSPAQILLRWALQQNFGIIPKARAQERIQENIDLDFVIPDKDMNLLLNMSTKEKFSWDPNTIA